MNTFIKYCKTRCRSGYGCKYRKSAIPISWFELRELCPMPDKVMALPKGGLLMNAHHIDKGQGSKLREGQQKQVKVRVKK